MVPESGEVDPVSEAKPWRIIVVDDDAEMRGLIQRFLGEHGFAVRAAASGGALDAAIAREPADAIVLDLMMPGEDGLTICRRMRGAGDMTPIIMLTARGDPVDRIIGLEMGADDYLAKPFTPRELVARLNALFRRTTVLPLGEQGTRYRFGPFEFDPAAMILTRDGTVVTLSSREHALLEALAAGGGRPLTRSHLIDRALGRDAEVTDRAVDVQIARLRKAIGEDADDPRWIKTVWGIGYQLADVTRC